MRDQDFDRLYTEHAARLFGFLVYHTGDRTLAEDVLADTFERALRRRRAFDSRKASEKTWLYAIALNLLRDRARRQAAEGRALERHVHSIGSNASPEPAMLERRSDLQRALGRLSPEEREAVALRFGADLTMPEIARLQRKRLTTIEGRVYRALEKLRQELG